MNETVLGMRIDFNEQFAKQSSSSRCNLDPLSNSNALLFALEKHDFPSTSTDAEMQIDFNEQSEKQDSGS
jgi:hypothetical protein